MLVVNAGNIDKDYAWITAEIKPAGDAVAVNTSSRYALLAVQGPAALAVRPNADERGAGLNQVLPVRHRRGGQRARHDLAYRVYRRRWGRDLRRASGG